jgi:hypothetical protein
LGGGGDHNKKNYKGPIVKQKNIFGIGLGYIRFWEKEQVERKNKCDIVV